MDKMIILCDVDGVLLEWENAFHEWMVDYGYSLQDEQAHCKAKRYAIDMEEKDKLIHFFFNSAKIGFLSPFRDAYNYAPKLADLGYRFHAISSFSDKLHAGVLRARNLNTLFGPIFSSFTFLPTGSRKGSVLSQYKDSGLYFIDDGIRNTLDGHELGLRSLLMEDSHSENVDVPFPKLKTWEQIVDHIVTNNTGEFYGTESRY